MISKIFKTHIVTKIFAKDQEKKIRYNSNKSWDIAFLLFFPYGLSFQDWDGGN